MNSININVGTPAPYSVQLQEKIAHLNAKRKKVTLGRVSFDSPLLLAPMSAICHAPFRLLMQELGAGGTVSELVSCHGINYANMKTRKMLWIHPKEKNVGLQLFGEDALAMAKAAEVANDFKPDFIDINMGCPVRKVVSKGGGSALLKETKELAQFFKTIKKAIDIPLTIKIRTGWDSDSINAEEVINIADGEGIEFVAVHGRTRTQQYKGTANWELLEGLAQSSKRPVIGNGDLHSPVLVKNRMMNTNCQALMLGRGPLRDPFIFLTSYLDDPTDSPFCGKDYLEIINRYLFYLREYLDNERTLIVQLRKIIVWFVAGFPAVAEFRGKMFQTQTLEEVLELTEEYLEKCDEISGGKKKVDLNRPFMMGGHG